MAERAPLDLSLQRPLGADLRAAVPPRHRLLRWVRAALDDTPAQIAIRFVDAPEGTELNRAYRGKDAPTNVLSFRYDDGGMPASDGCLHGDLVVCVPVVLREAREQGKAPEAHFAHLVVHGMLHLRGLDHETPEQAHTMEARETELLARLGFGDPYA